MHLVGHTAALLDAAALLLVHVATIAPSASSPDFFSPVSAYGQEVSAAKPKRIRIEATPLTGMIAAV